MGSLFLVCSSQQLLWASYCWDAEGISCTFCAIAIQQHTVLCAQFMCSYRELHEMWYFSPRGATKVKFFTPWYLIHLRLMTHKCCASNGRIQKELFCHIYYRKNCLRGRVVVSTHGHVYPFQPTETFKEEYRRRKQEEITSWNHLTWKFIFSVVLWDSRLQAFKL